VLFPVTLDVLVLQKSDERLSRGLSTQTHGRSYLRNHTGCTNAPFPGHIPDREADPGLAGRVERHGEMPAAERRQVRGGDDLPVDLPAVTPDDFGERQRKGPFGISRDRPRGGGSVTA
jgi:hypothetical protein